MTAWHFTQNLKIRTHMIEVTWWDSAMKTAICCGKANGFSAKLRCKAYSMAKKKIIDIFTATLLATYLNFVC